MEIEITQERIEEVIRSEVRHAIDGMEFYHDYESYNFVGYVRVRIDEIIEEYMKEQFREIIENEITEIAKYEVMAEFVSKPIKRYNGYQTKEYASYDSYLLECIEEKMKATWTIGNVIEREVKSKVDKIWEKCVEEGKKAVANKFAEIAEGIDANARA